MYSRLSEPVYEPPNNVSDCIDPVTCLIIECHSNLSKRRVANSVRTASQLQALGTPPDYSRTKD